MLDKILKTIYKYNMISHGELVLVGVSGGADSLALLHALKQLQDTLSMRLFAAHVNHGLRGKEADKDAEFVSFVSARWGIPFFLKEVDIHSLAKEWGVSEEEAGRRVRYDFFNEVLKNIDGHKIALAHHRDDQAETILYNIVRGTGMQGLQGMRPVRDRHIIRPLLEVTRKQIEKYCRDNKLDFRIDATNQDTTYVRNRIRHMLIPFVQKNFNPNFTVTLVRMGEIVREDEDFLSGYCQELLSNCAVIHSDCIRIFREIFQAYHIAIKRRILRISLEILKKGLTDVQYSHISSILKMLDQPRVGAAITLPGKITAVLDYDSLVISVKMDSKPVPDFKYTLEIPGEIFVKESNIIITVRKIERKQVLDKDPWCIYIDGDTVQGCLEIRNRRKGDRFRPLGMQGRKKLKDYFIDKKIPRSKRDAIPIVVDGDNIIWVVGCQISDDYKVSVYTKNMLELKAHYYTEGGRKIEKKYDNNNR